MNSDVVSRFLVFFDDGYAQYCVAKELHKVYYQSELGFVVLFCFVFWFCFVFLSTQHKILKIANYNMGNSCFT